MGGAITQKHTKCTREKGGGGGLLNLTDLQSVSKKKSRPMQNVSFFTEN